MNSRREDGTGMKNPTETATHSMAAVLGAKMAAGVKHGLSGRAIRLTVATMA